MCTFVLNHFKVSNKDNINLKCYLKPVICVTHGAFTYWRRKDHARCCATRESPPNSFLCQLPLAWFLFSQQGATRRSSCGIRVSHYYTCIYTNIKLVFVLLKKIRHGPANTLDANTLMPEINRKILLLQSTQEHNVLNLPPTAGIHDRPCKSKTLFLR